MRNSTVARREKNTRTNVLRTRPPGTRKVFRHQVLPVFSADKNVGTALRETYRAFARVMASNQQTLGLSLNMWFALRVLWDTDGLSQAELARAMEIAPAAVVGVVNSLESAGYAERRRNEADKRIYCVFLTRKGRQIRKKASTRALQVDAKALRGIDVQEIDTVLDVLARLRRNLARDD